MKRETNVKLDSKLYNIVPNVYEKKNTKVINILSLINNNNYCIIL